jgi:dTDP-glucose 4,6-dehydratase
VNSILVTGGAGFIGSNFVNFYLENYPKTKIICIDKMTYAAKMSYLDSALEKRNFIFRKGDICDANFLTELFNEFTFDAVVNFAAESHVDNSINGPEEFLLSNFMGVFHLLECVRRFPEIRFHQVSTDEVYGDTPIDSSRRFTEEDALRPSSPYSSSKAAADLLILSYHRSFGTNVTISRCVNNYGPHQHEEKLIPVIINNALSNRDIPLYGDGKNVRDWIYVLDHCTAIDTILRKGLSGEIYNVGANNELSNFLITKVILKKIHSSSSKIVYVSDRPGHDARYSVETKKIRDLGWQPTSSFESTIISTIEWIKSNYYSEL